MQADTCRQPRPIRFVRPGRVGWATTSIAVGLLWQILLLLLFWLLPATFFKGAGHTHSGAGCRNGWTPRLSWFKWCRREVRSSLHKPTDQDRSPLPGNPALSSAFAYFKRRIFPILPAIQEQYGKNPIPDSRRLTSLLRSRGKRFIRETKDRKNLAVRGWRLQRRNPVPPRLTKKVSARIPTHSRYQVEIQALLVSADQTHDKSLYLHPAG